MPVLESSFTAPPLWARGRHLETIIPAFFRKVEGVVYTRERLVMADADFIDLDWSVRGYQKLAILNHGLEGSSKQPYVLGMVKELNNGGWDTLSWNFRSCSGELNNHIRLYHAGSTEDLANVVSHALKEKKYKEIALIGFSLGGGIVLKYLGEYPLEPEIAKAIVFSAPCDLYGCAQTLSAGFNRIYLTYFLMTLKSKLLKKSKLYPEILSGTEWPKIDNFAEFDDHFTAPLHGFKDSLDYYIACSAKKNILDIPIPTLIINAANDPFMNESCYPIEECLKSKNVFLEMPANGGHLGFMKDTINGRYWSEVRASSFLSKQTFSSEHRL